MHFLFMYFTFINSLNNSAQLYGMVLWGVTVQEVYQLRLTCMTAFHYETLWVVDMYYDVFSFIVSGIILTGYNKLTYYFFIKPEKQLTS